LTELKRSEVKGEGTYTEFETPYVITYAGYAFDHDVGERKAASFDVKDLPNFDERKGKGVTLTLGPIHTIQFKSVVSKKAAIGDRSVTESETSVKDGFYFIDGELWGEAEIKKNVPEDKLAYYMEMRLDSETGFLVKTRHKSFITVFRENDAIITWKGDHYETIQWGLTINN